MLPAERVARQVDLQWKQETFECRRGKLGESVKIPFSAFESIHSAAGRAHPAKPEVEGNRLRFRAACSAGLARDTGTRSEAGKLTFAPGEF